MDTSLVAKLAKKGHTSNVRFIRINFHPRYLLPRCIRRFRSCVPRSELQRGCHRFKINIILLAGRRSAFVSVLLNPWRVDDIVVLVLIWFLLEAVCRSLDFSLKLDSIRFRF